MSSSPDVARWNERVIRRPVRTVPVVPAAGPLAGTPREEGQPEEPDHPGLETVQREAFEEGRRAGMAEAMASMEARRIDAAISTADRLRAAAAEVAALRQAVVDDVVADAVGLAAELVEELVGQAFEVSDSPGRAAIVRALALAPEGPDLVVRVHPDCGLDDDEIGAMVPGGKVEVVHDRAVDPRGCLVVVGGCHIDAQVSSAIARVRRSLEALRPAASARRHRSEARAVEPVGGLGR